MARDDLLIKSHDILGMSVVEPDGEKLGVVRELFVDQREGVIRFAILESGGLFGAGGKFHPVPWRLLDFDSRGRSLVASFSKERLKAAPSYDRDQLNSATYGWGAQSLRHFEADMARDPFDREAPGDRDHFDRLHDPH
jgi:sporulation protein YlmC with PRC-barrel domain